MVASQTAAFIRRHRTVSLDTSVFIYFVERHPSYYDLCDAVFRSIEEKRIEAVTSTLTLIELLVQPYRMKKDDLVFKFYSMFSTYPNLRWIQLTLDISDVAARLRAEYRLKTPDAIQIASALSVGATGLICNDKAFRKVANIDCLVLDDLAP